ncbi:MAG: NAD(P) transhydrogenase alpha subunit, partial [uncultured Rubrobacteraceae bacterium]
ARAPRAVGHLHRSRFSGVGADLARPEHAPYAAHERDERHPRHRPSGCDHRDRHRERPLHHSGGFYSRGLRSYERGRRLLGYQPDARHVPSAETESKEEEGI